jgi:hypothetical protein
MNIAVERKSDATVDIFKDGELDRLSVPRAKLALVLDGYVASSTIEEMLCELNATGRAEKSIPLGKRFQVG